MSINYIINSPESGRCVFLMGGPPLGGKGSASVELSKKREGYHVSTGAYFRKKRVDDVEFDRMYGPIIDQGDLLPDKMILGFCQEAIPEINKHPGEIYLDGVIRTERVGLALQHLLTRPRLALYFNIHVELHEAKMRAERRAVQEGRSDDFDPQTVTHRYCVWNKNESNLIRGLRRSGIQVVDIDGSKPKDVVISIIEKKIIRHVGDIISDSSTTRPGHQGYTSRNKGPGWRQPQSVLELGIHPSSHPHGGPRATRG